MDVVQQDFRIAYRQAYTNRVSCRVSDTFGLLPPTLIFEAVVFSARCLVFGYKFWFLITGYKDKVDALNDVGLAESADIKTILRSFYNRKMPVMVRATEFGVLVHFALLITGLYVNKISASICAVIYAVLILTWLFSMNAFSRYVAAILKSNAERGGFLVQIYTIFSKLFKKIRREKNEDDNAVVDKDMPLSTRSVKNVVLIDDEGFQVDEPDNLGRIVLGTVNTNTYATLGLIFSHHLIDYVTLALCFSAGEINRDRYSVGYLFSLIGLSGAYLIVDIVVIGNPGSMLPYLYLFCVVISPIITTPSSHPNYDYIVGISGYLALQVIVLLVIVRYILYAIHARRKKNKQN